MQSRCPATVHLKTSGEYAVKHNPWTYFAAGRKNCAKFDVPMGTPRRGAFARDIKSGHLPNVGMAIPNLATTPTVAPSPTRMTG